jgi:hypothetical protein
MLYRPIGFVFRLALKGEKPITASLDTNKFSRQYACYKPKKWAFPPFLGRFANLYGAKKMPGIESALWRSLD